MTSGIPVLATTQNENADRSMHVRISLRPFVGQWAELLQRTQPIEPLFATTSMSMSWGKPCSYWLLRLYDAINALRLAVERLSSLNKSVEMDARKRFYKAFH